MSITNFPEYARVVSDLLDNLLNLGQVQRLNVQVDQRSMVRGYIAGTLIFNDDSELHFREFLDLTQAEPKLMYAYHYQDGNATLIFRYDNAPHRPLLTQPEHKHTATEITFSTVPTLDKVLDEILTVFINEN